MRRICILGVNGFIGSHLSEALLTRFPDVHIDGLDRVQDNLERCLSHPRFHFTPGDMTQEKEWVQTHIQQCDLVIPLAAIANPALYVSHPLRVFELDFEANLEIVRLCVAYKKRLIFPSTSEVYGMCPDGEFDEETSPFVLGPISKQRWIYSCSKQMIDRIIYAYGQESGLDYTLFRPFNWVGPRLDRLSSSPQSSARVVTQFISNLIYHGAIRLVNGGHQRRSFIDIEDAIHALCGIIENPEGKASRQILNIGNPQNNFSIAELAHLILQIAHDIPAYRAMAQRTTLIATNEADYYGQGYQDVQARVPSIRRAQTLLNWSPKISLEESLRKTLLFYADSPAYKDIFSSS